MNTQPTQPQNLEVGQIIQGENCRLVVTAIVEPRSESDIDLIYDAASKEYKGIVGGKKSVMYMDSNGESVYGPIVLMPKNIFDEKVKKQKAKAALIVDIEYSWSYGGDWYITTDLILSGRGIKLSNDGSNHKRGKRTYHVTDAALKALKNKYNCEYTSR